MLLAYMICMVMLHMCAGSHSLTAEREKYVLIVDSTSLTRERASNCSSTKKLGSCC